MTREILFRGYCPEENRWVYGFYLKTGELEERGNREVHLIMKHLEGRRIKFYEIDPFTLCQYSGFDDHDGNELFDGDIVFKLFRGQPYTARVKYDAERGAWIVGVGNTDYIACDVWGGEQPIRNVHKGVWKDGGKTVYDGYINLKWGNAERLGNCAITAG